MKKAMPGPWIWVLLGFSTPPPIANEKLVLKLARLPVKPSHMRTGCA
jgi:hypothetical protein